MGTPSCTCTNLPNSSWQACLARHGRHHGSVPLVQVPVQVPVVERTDALNAQPFLSELARLAASSVAVTRRKVRARSHKNNNVTAVAEVCGSSTDAGSTAPCREIPANKCNFATTNTSLVGLLVHHRYPVAHPGNLATRGPGARLSKHGRDLHVEGKGECGRRRGGEETCLNNMTKSNLRWTLLFPLLCRAIC